MKKFILTILIFTVLLCGCHGCSYIQETFFKKQTEQNTDKQGQQQEEPKRKAEPIPVNPQHS